MNATIHSYENSSLLLVERVLLTIISSCFSFVGRLASSQVSITEGSAGQQPPVYILAGTPLPNAHSKPRRV
ncbi:hypothetical protein Ddc_05992 [Ditylenchus destructor]|nr:hypothetical protein Ddc_05992 [Ditylenchus destructor]